MKPDSRSDDELVELTLQGDERAFGVLFQRHNPGLERYVLGRVHDYDIARSIVQRTWINADEGLASYRPMERFRGWLVRIADNLLIDLWRRRRPPHERILDIDMGNTPEPGEFRPTQIPDPAPDPARQIELADRMAAVHREMAKLKARHRKALKLILFKQLSYAEAAKRMRVPVNTLATYVLRGRRELASALLDDTDS